MSELEPAAPAPPETSTPPAVRQSAGSSAFTSSDKVRSLLTQIEERIANDPSAGKLRWLLRAARASGALDYTAELQRVVDDPGELDAMLMLFVGVALELLGDDTAAALQGHDLVNARQAGQQLLAKVFDE